MPETELTILQKLQRIQDEIECLGTLAFLYFPRFAQHFLEILFHTTLSQKFVSHIQEKVVMQNDLDYQWSAVGVFEGFPCIDKLDHDEPRILHKLTNWENIGLLIDFNVTKLKSLMDMSHLLKQTTCLNPSRDRNVLLSAVIHSYKRVIKLAVEILRRSDSQMRKGLILFLDVNKTTPATIDAENRHQLPEYNTKMQRILREIANTILLCENNSKYWLLGGDSFVSFSIPKTSDETEIGLIVYRIITEVKRKLKEIVENEGVSFRGGAHFGKLLLAGDKLYLNSDFIKAVRAQQLCEKDAEIIITHQVKERIEKKGKEIFDRPEVLYEGKYTYMQPNRVYIQFGEEEIDLFTVKVED